MLNSAAVVKQQQKSFIICKNFNIEGSVEKTSFEMLENMI